MLISLLNRAESNHLKDALLKKKNRFGSCCLYMVKQLQSKITNFCINVRTKRCTDESNKVTFSKVIVTEEKSSITANFVPVTQLS